MLSRKPAEEPEDTATTTLDDGGDDALSTADVKDPTEYEQVFKPKSKLGLSPPVKMDPFPAPKNDGQLQYFVVFKCFLSKIYRFHFLWQVALIVINFFLYRNP